MRVIACFIAACALAGCATSNEVVRFNPRAGAQEAIIRDGQSVIQSRGKNSIVTLRPATRAVGARPVFVVTIQNTSRQPLTFAMTQVSARQMLGSNEQELKVFSYEELAQEEQNAHNARVVLAAVGAGLNSYSAGNSYWRQAHANQQNAQLAANVQMQGERNMAAIESLTIKDHTLMPGEQYGGRLVLQGPEAGTTPNKSYVLAMAVGSDLHEFSISQGPN